MKKTCVLSLICLLFVLVLTLFVIYDSSAVCKADLLYEGDLAPNSKSACLMELNSGKIIYKKNENERLAPASMTKIMTMILVMEAIKSEKISLDDIVLATKEACELGGSQIYLEVNEKMTVEDLLKSMAIASANDATMALAIYIAGNEENFVSMMNERARDLSLKDTNFVNPYGFDNENHYSSSYDMAIMSSHLIKNYPEILSYTSRYEDYVREDEKRFWLVNTNKLVKFMDGVDGLKTGWTKNAGYCLSCTMTKDNERYIAVAMNAKSPELRNKDICAMLNFGVNNYDLVKYKSKGEIIEEIRDIRLKPDVYHLLIEEDINVLIKKNINGNNISSLIENGKIKVFVNDEYYDEYDLGLDVVFEKKKFLDVLVDFIKHIFLNN